ncbi:MAG: hypothetical protein PHS49_06495 [Candidatus Gracilibacteria bacterium]|nr:hypothetical protein [Candidatus Gracilibacteria bacterium]
MMGFIKFMQKRPSDTTIRISRVVFGLILVFALYYNLIIQNGAIDSNFFWVDISESTQLYIKYAIVALGIVPIYMGATNICLLKKKHMRILQSIFGILLFYISGKIVEGPDMDVDTLVAFMGIFPLFAGITGKCITSNCLKYKETITKIRV